MPYAGSQEALFYQEAGHGHAIVFIPGFGGVGSFWKRQMEFFKPRFRVITADQRGTGASARSRGAYSLDGMTDDLETVLDAAGIERATLVGHSTGGAIAQALAVRMPKRVAGMVLSSTWCKPGNYFRRCFEFRRSLLEIGATDLFHKAGVFFRYPPGYAETHDAAFDTVGEVDVDITIARINAILAADLSLITDRITAPTMVIASRDDCLVPSYMSADVARRIPGARQVELDHGGHFLPETRAGEYNALLDDFFSSPGLPGAGSDEPMHT
jgi:aminoacrylate hydrolase